MDGNLRRGSTDGTIRGTCGLLSLRDIATTVGAVIARFSSRSSVLKPDHDASYHISVGISDAILLKPGRLTPSEFEIIKRHTVIGADMLDETAKQSTCGDFLQIAAEIARYHHERFDGTGYPSGLKGQDIPLSARIVAVADVFDALTSKRVYKDAISPDDARSMIEQESGRHFDPKVVAAFCACFDDFLAVHHDNDPGGVSTWRSTWIDDLSLATAGTRK